MSTIHLRDVHAVWLSPFESAADALSAAAALLRDIQAREDWGSCLAVTYSVEEDGTHGVHVIYQTLEDPPVPIVGIFKGKPGAF